MNSRQVLSSNVTFSNLKTYYADVFPTQDIINLLTHCNSLLQQRVISFSVRKNTMDPHKYGFNEYFHKYPIFYCKDDFEKYLKEKLPYRIDVAGVMSVPIDAEFIREIEQNNVYYLEKELVLDIDVEPFDEQYIKTMCKKLNIVLREQLGCKQFFFVFSGKKGVHCWICDKNKVGYTDEDRKRFIDYLFKQIPELNQQEKGGLDVGPILLKHMIKLPFSVHPMTGKICIPFDIKNIDSYNFSQFPSVDSDIVEVNPFLHYFRDFVSVLCK